MNTRNWWAKETVVLVGIVLVAAFFRLYRLPAIPTGFQFDEAYNAADALRVLAGARPLFLPANAGREVLYTYLQAGMVALLGPELLALRLTSALLGILTIPATYALTRALFPQPRATALLTTVLMAVSLWHVHFSRYGIRAVTLPLVAIATIYTFWLGVRERYNAKGFLDEVSGSSLGAWTLSPARSRVWLFALSGVFTSLAVYTHPSGRLLPFILGVFALYLAWTNRACAGRYLAGLIVTGLVAFVLFIPLGLYFWNNQAAFLGHPSDVSILTPRVNQGNLMGTLLDNTLRVAGMFLWRGDEFWTHNLAGRPVFDPLTGLAFLFGLGLSLGRVIDRPRDPASAPFVLILVWLGIMLLPTLLSDQAPNFSRAIGAMPAVFIFPALGLEWVTSAVKVALAHRTKDERGETMDVRPSSFVLRRAPWLVAAVLVLSGLWTFHDYFVTFASAPQTYYNYDQDKVDAVATLTEAARTDHVYLASLWATHATIAFLTRGTGIKSFEASQTLVLPPNDGRDAVYAFPPEQRAQMAALSARLGDLATREEVTDRYGRPLLVLYRLPARYLPTANAPWGDARFQPVQRVEMDFGGEMRLLGYTFDPHIPAVELAWQALRPMTRDYTVFVHALDGRGERWGQVDREPGDTSYRTTAWTPGEVILDRYALNLKPCAPPGKYRLVVGVYHLPTGQPLPTSLGQPGVVLGTVQLQGRAILPVAEAMPQHRLDAALADWVLLGYDGRPQVLAGDVLPMNLYWRGQTDQVVALQVRSRESDQVWTLWQGQIAAPEGRVLCQALWPRLPADLPAGTYTLALALTRSPLHPPPKLVLSGVERLGEGDYISLGELTVLPLARSFVTPTPQYPLAARLSDQVELLGYDLTREERTLQVTLYWRTQGVMDAGYTVFAHLLDNAGQLQSQHDGVPAEGARPTTSWVPGEVVADRHSLPIDPAALSGEYLLQVGMYDAAWVRLPAFDAQGRRLPDDRIVLGTVSLP